MADDDEDVPLGTFPRATRIWKRTSPRTTRHWGPYPEPPGQGWDTGKHPPSSTSDSRTASSRSWMPPAHAAPTPTGDPGTDGNPPTETVAAINFATVSPPSSGRNYTTTRLWTGYDRVPVKNDTNTTSTTASLVTAPSTMSSSTPKSTAVVVLSFGLSLLCAVLLL